MRRDTSPDEDASSLERGVADRIEAYLAAHPGAADTLAGISGFWLAGIPKPLVQRALDDLLRRQVVKSQRLPGGEVVYSRAEPGAAGERHGSHDT